MCMIYFKRTVDFNTGFWGWANMIPKTVYNSYQSLYGTGFLMIEFLAASSNYGLKLSTTQLITWRTLYEWGVSHHIKKNLVRFKAVVVGCAELKDNLSHKLFSWFFREACQILSRIELPVNAFDTKFWTNSNWFWMMSFWLVPIIDKDFN